MIGALYLPHVEVVPTEVSKKIPKGLLIEGGRLLAIRVKGRKRTVNCMRFHIETELKH
jgi:hypothetical protein